MTKASAAPIDVVIAAAGSGQRLGHDRPKAFVEIGGRAMLCHALDTAAALPARRTVVTVPVHDAQRWVEAVGRLVGTHEVLAVAGGETRQASVRHGLLALREAARRRGEGDAHLALVHDAARPCASLALWRRVADEAARSGAAVPVVPSVDSLKELDEAGAVRRSVDRSRVMRVQTPQGFDFAALLEAHNAAAAKPAGEPAAGAGEGDATDDAALFERAGRRVATVPGEEGNIKVTTPQDLEAVGRQLGAPPAALPVRVGYGYDVHPLASGRRLILGGVHVPCERGLDGHSDADALAHAVTDALLGAAGLGDIGQKFPAEDEQWKDADSIGLLTVVVADLAAAGLRPLHVDATVLAEQPRLLPHLGGMRSRLAEALGLPASSVNVKATRGEGLGSIGRGEGIAAHAVATVGPA